MSVLTATTTKDLEYVTDFSHKDAMGNNALHLALIKNNNKIKEHLLIKGIDPNSINNQGRSPIFYSKSLDDVKLLVRYGASIIIKDIHGQYVYNSNEFVKLFNEQHLSLF
jgi:ankyrin repeat protein